MYTNESAPPAGSRPCHGSRSYEEPSSRAGPGGRRSCGADETFSRLRPESSNTKASSTGVQGRVAAIETASNEKETQKHPQKTLEPMGDSENVIVEFQSALTACQKELEEQRAEHSRLRLTNSKLRATNKTQYDTLIQWDLEARKTHGLLNKMIEEYLNPYAQTHGIRPHKWVEESFLTVLDAMSKDAADANSSAAEASSYAVEVRTLTEQVRMLQKEMLANVDKVHVASDEQFAQDFRVITSLVKSLSRTIRISDTVDITEVLNSGHLLKNVSRHHWNNRARKKLLVEAWVWSALVQRVFRTPFVIFGTQCETLAVNWQSIYLGDHCHGWPVPTSLCEMWRCTTIEGMLGLVDRDVIIHGKQKDIPGELDSSIIAARDSVLNTIGHRLTKLSTTTVNRSQVQNIVDKAFALALQMSLQRVRFQITHPEVSDKFDTNRMKYMPDLDGEDVDDGIVAFIVNPGLTKWGDAHGKNLDHRHDIVPSLVQLEATQEQEVEEPKPAPPRWAAIVNGDPKGASKGERTNGGESQR
jgi:hypothetical protein